MGTICNSPPDSLMVQGQVDGVLWWCPPRTTTDPIHVVVRNSHTFIFSNESNFLKLAMPKVVSPFPLNVRLILEETTDVASEAQRLSSTLQDTVRNLHNWPCVDKVQVEMSVVKPHTNQWMVENESISEETRETAPPYLPLLNESQVGQLIQTLNLNDDHSIGYELFLYLPASRVERSIPSSFRVGESKLFMVGEWDTGAVSDWLSHLMGIPIEAVDGDGSIPTWYDEWYWHQSSRMISMEIQELYSRVHHLMKESLELSPSTTTSSEGHYYYQKRLYHRLTVLLQTSRIQSEFPFEHGAAIFAPLLFPLLFPFFIGTMKEIKRYKEKKRSKKEETIKTEKLE